LKPDPLEVSGGLGEIPEPRLKMVSRATGIIFGNPAALLAVTAMVVGHMVMVGVMTTTPLHMDDNDHSVQIIGFVISFHVVGMYAFSPVVGWLVDRFGRTQMIGLAGMTLFLATQIAGRSHAEESFGFFVGLFLLGLGWSFAVIAGSSLLVDSITIANRVAVQGTADLAMTAAGAIGGIASGPMLAKAGYFSLNMAAAVISLGLVGIVIVFTLNSRRPVTSG
jgi:MFS family permease